MTTKNIPVEFFVQTDYFLKTFITCRGCVLSTVFTEEMMMMMRPRVRYLYEVPVSAAYSWSPVCTSVGVPAACGSAAAAAGA